MTDAFEIYVATIEEINNLFGEMLVYAANTTPTDERIKQMMISYADKVYDIAYNARLEILLWMLFLSLWSRYQEHHMIWNILQRM